MDIAYFSKLARLELQPEEKEKFSKDLEEILQYIDQLQQSNVEEIIESHEHTNTFRADEKREEHLPEGDQLLALAPDREGKWLKVHPVKSSWGGITQKENFHL